MLFLCEVALMLLFCVTASGCLIWYSECTLIIPVFRGEKDGESERKNRFIYMCVRPAIPFHSVWSSQSDYSLCRQASSPDYPVSQRRKNVSWSVRLSRHWLPYTVSQLSEQRCDIHLTLFAPAMLTLCSGGLVVTKSVFCCHLLFFCLIMLFTQMSHTSSCVCLLCVQIRHYPDRLHRHEVPARRPQLHLQWQCHALRVFCCARQRTESLPADTPRGVWDILQPTFAVICIFAVCKFKEKLQVITFYR